MSILLTVIIGISLICLFLTLFYYTFKNNEWCKFFIYITAIIVIFIILHLAFDFPKAKSIPVSKGNEYNEIYFIIILYFSMIVGMICQHLYDRFSKPKHSRGKFDLGLFFVPIFASPIVFIPLFAALQNAQVELNGFTQSSLMVYFVAFENGFFWKEIVNKRTKEQ